MIEISDLPTGIYLVNPEKLVYKIDLPINVPVTKKMNLMTGEIIYPTNADRIRVMTDEELAEFFWIRADCELCPNRKQYCSDDCKGAWLEWLKQEVKDE